MDRARIGRSIRAIRVRVSWRQDDLAARAGVSRSFVARLERGAWRSLDAARLEKVCETLGADLDVRVRWRGESLDRLLDEAHAQLVDIVVRRLRQRGWDCRVEVSFNEYGERGSIDVLGWHAESRTLLVIEVKSAIADAQSTVSTLDRKTRLAVRIAGRMGWQPAEVGRLLVVADTSRNRRRVEALEALFGAAYPVRGIQVSRWLRSPRLSDAPGGTAGAALAPGTAGAAFAGLHFLPYATTEHVRSRGIGRIRVRLAAGGSPRRLLSRGTPQEGQKPAG